MDTAGHFDFRLILIINYFLGRGGCHRNRHYTRIFRFRLILCGFATPGHRLISLPCFSSSTAGARGPAARFFSAIVSDAEGCPIAFAGALAILQLSVCSVAHAVVRTTGGQRTLSWFV